MARVKRTPHAAALFILTVVLALLPGAALAASPSPSPSLDKVLAPPPSGYVELTTGTFHGEFTAHDWAVNASGVSPTETENTLNNLGFVDGFGMEWSSASLRRALIEAVMAFGGGRGAKNALTALEGTDKADSHYAHADTITGIPDYYGGHFTTNAAFEDEFVFVKGNDLFIVIFAGAQDTVLPAATDQAKAQYNAAPAETVPSSQWPENQSTPSSGPGPFVLLGGVAVPIAIVALIVGVVIQRRRRAAVAMATYAPPPMSAVPQMSPDGSFWWDGQAWQDASQHVPPGAQRSADGSLWWDGRNWRPVPQAQQPPAG